MYNVSVAFLILFLLRVLELKQEMVNLELLEYHYFDDILTDMKLTPVSCTLCMHMYSSKSLCCILE